MRGMREVEGLFPARSVSREQGALASALALAAVVPALALASALAVVAGETVVAVVAVVAVVDASQDGARAQSAKGLAVASPVTVSEIEGLVRYRAGFLCKKWLRKAKKE